jgi:hypothetical protein
MTFAKRMANLDRRLEVLLGPCDRQPAASWTAFVTLCWGRPRRLTPPVSVHRRRESRKQREVRLNVRESAPLSWGSRYGPVGGLRFLAVMFSSSTKAEKVMAA